MFKKLVKKKRMTLSSSANVQTIEKSPSPESCDVSDKLQLSPYYDKKVHVLVQQTPPYESWDLNEFGWKSQVVPFEAVRDETDSSSKDGHLRLFAFLGFRMVIEGLLEEGIKINGSDKEGKNPLYCCLYGAAYISKSYPGEYYETKEKEDNITEFLKERLQLLDYLITEGALISEPCKVKFLDKINEFIGASTGQKKKEFLEKLRNEFTDSLSKPRTPGENPAIAAPPTLFSSSFSSSVSNSADDENKVVKQNKR